MDKITLKKFEVCANCWCIGLVHPDCMCAHANSYKTIELEFEVCSCCGHVINDGEPANTLFNDEQIKKLER